MLREQRDEYPILCGGVVYIYLNQRAGNVTRSMLLSIWMVLRYLIAIT